MVAVTFAPVASAVCAPRVVLARKAFSGVNVSAVSRRNVCRAARPAVVASAERKRIVLPAAVSSGLIAMMASPLTAEAAVSPSLKNLLFSLIAGGVVLVGIVVAVSGVASFDPVARKNK